MAEPDPLDSPPADHGSDRYDYVEVTAPEGVRPPPALLAHLDPPCEDCRANLFLRYVGELSDDAEQIRFWQPTIAHDDSCPTLARIEEAHSG